MTPEDFLRTLVNSRCLIGNSSAGVRECSFLGLPVVNIGSRQTGRDRGPNLTDAAYNKRSIVSATRNQINKNRLPSSNLYGDGNAGQHIADLLATIPLTIEKRITY